MQSSSKKKSDEQNAYGQIVDGVFSIPLQINHEDTDAGGVVYYGNYLGFMERCRNAYLRMQGFPLRILTDQYHVLFVVTEARLKYLPPARLDDELRITLRIGEISGASTEFEHLILRGTDCLVKGEIKLATLNSESFLPCRIPKKLIPSLCASPITEISHKIE